MTFNANSDSVSITPDALATLYMVQWPTPSNPPNYVYEKTLSGAAISVYWLIKDNIAYGSPIFPGPVTIPECGVGCTPAL